mmetsp:Transcript_133649/g.285796  ORF Transcript_133649/g.285796 Transcript_133649/m.285796 type:complete len:293 (-) Transcript_133649:443-1321(-)
MRSKRILSKACTLTHPELGPLPVSKLYSRRSPINCSSSTVEPVAKRLGKDSESNSRPRRTTTPPRSAPPTTCHLAGRSGPESSSVCGLALGDASTFGFRRNSTPGEANVSSPTGWSPHGYGVEVFALRPDTRTCWRMPKSSVSRVSSLMLFPCLPPKARLNSAYGGASVMYLGGWHNTMNLLNSSGVHLKCFQSSPRKLQPSASNLLFMSRTCLTHFHLCALSFQSISRVRENHGNSPKRPWSKVHPNASTSSCGRRWMFSPERMELKSTLPRSQRIFSLPGYCCAVPKSTK